MVDYNRDSFLPKCVIVDIDGTLAWNVTNRDFFDESRVHEDAVRWFVHDVLNILGESDLIDKIFIVTARKDTVLMRLNTKYWIYHACKFSENTLSKIEILMRKEEYSDTSDSESKMNLFNKHILGKYEPVVVFEDRAEVVRNCWKPLGVPVFRCGLIDQDE
ncbi:MAG: hypothetical protein N3A54_05305 [Patescibacteria group bacterium]|nr:hypothetical protein [Patescibacteria group bacterium]